MPPKQQPSKKTVEKAKAKVVEVRFISNKRLVIPLGLLLVVG